MDDRWWIERGRVGCDEAVGDGKSERYLTLAELELDMCWDRHPCSSPFLALPTSHLFDVCSSLQPAHMDWQSIWLTAYSTIFPYLARRLPLIPHIVQCTLHIIDCDLILCNLSQSYNSVTISLAYVTPINPLTTIGLHTQVWRGTNATNNLPLHLQASRFAQLLVEHFYHRWRCVWHAMSRSHYQHHRCRICIFTGQLAPGEPQPFCMLVKPCIHWGNVQHSPRAFQMALSCQTITQHHPPLHPRSISLQANADNDTPFRGCPSILGGIKRPSRPFYSSHKPCQPCSSFHLHSQSPHWLYYLSHPFIYDFYDPQRRYTSPSLCSMHPTSHPAILLLHTSHTAPWHNPCTPFSVTSLRSTSFQLRSLYTTHTLTRQLVAHPASNANFHSFCHSLFNPSGHHHFYFPFLTMDIEACLHIPSTCTHPRNICTALQLPFHLFHQPTFLWWSDNPITRVPAVTDVAHITFRSQTTTDTPSILAPLIHTLCVQTPLKPLSFSINTVSRGLL